MPTDKPALDLDAELVGKFKSLVASVEAFEWWAIHDYGCPRFLREHGQKLVAMLERATAAEAERDRLREEKERLRNKPCPHDGPENR